MFFVEKTLKNKNNYECICQKWLLNFFSLFQSHKHTAFRISVCEIESNTVHRHSNNNATIILEEGN